MSVAGRNNVVVHGPADAPPIVFAHGFGCDQNMWRHVWPAFADDHRVILFDHVGAGSSDWSAYDRDRYDSLHGYADGVLEIIDELGLTRVVFVGHSVSAMIGVLAASARPDPRPYIPVTASRPMQQWKVHCPKPFRERHRLISESRASISLAV